MNAGENLRELRRLERELRAELQPSGLIAELLFDKCFSCLLRCLLIAHADKSLFTAETQSFEERLQVINQVVLAGGQPTSDNDFLKSLSITQRYNTHYTRQFYKTLATLVALRGTGDDGLARLLGKEVAAE